MPVFRLLPPVFRISLGLLLCCSFVEADTVDDVEETKENLNEVVRLREALATERRAWREQKALMEAQVRLDQTGLENLETVLAELRPQLDSLGEESTQLALDLETSQRLVDFWTVKLESVKRRLAGQLDRFPPALKRQVSSKLSDSVSLDYREDPAKLKRVFDLCLEVISEVNQFHDEIHLLTEVHTLEDGQRAEFNVVYLGLSGGYYFSENSGLAGTIVWDGETWQWAEDRALLEDLVLLGAVLGGQLPPQYVDLPMPGGKGGAR